MPGYQWLRGSSDNCKLRVRGMPDDFAWPLIQDVNRSLRCRLPDSKLGSRTSDGTAAFAARSMAVRMDAAQGRICVLDPFRISIRASVDGATISSSAASAGSSQPKGMTPTAPTITGIIDQRVIVRGKRMASLSTGGFAKKNQSRFVPNPETTGGAVTIPWLVTAPHCSYVGRLRRVRRCWRTDCRSRWRRAGRRRPGRRGRPGSGYPPSGPAAGWWGRSRRTAGRGS